MVPYRQRARIASSTALLSIAQNPERMSIFVDNGQLMGSGATPSSWEYRYTLTVIIQDFADDFDMLAGAVMAFLAVEQPDVLTNPQLAEKAAVFETEIINTELADVSLKLDLREAVQLGVTPGTFIHPAEPPADSSVFW